MNYLKWCISTKYLCAQTYAKVIRMFSFCYCNVNSDHHKIMAQNLIPWTSVSCPHTQFVCHYHCLFLMLTSPSLSLDSSVTSVLHCRLSLSCTQLARASRRARLASASCRVSCAACSLAWWRSAWTVSLWADMSLISARRVSTQRSLAFSRSWTPRNSAKAVSLAACITRPYLVCSADLNSSSSYCLSLCGNLIVQWLCECISMYLCIK